MRVFIYPSFAEEDKGDGGIRRVVEAQLKWLPKFGIEIVEREFDADILACHAEMPNPWYKLYPDKIIVSMCHGLYWSEYDWGGWQQKANEKVMQLTRVADVVTAPTEWVAQSIRRNTSRDVRVIPHGVDAEDWEAKDNRGYVLWNKTRPDPVCDPKPLNDVVQVLDKIPFVSTFGDPMPNLTLTGRLPYVEAKSLIEHAGVYLCTSRETFGIGTLEAMAAGVPVVGYRWGGQAEFIEHEVDGYLATPHDFLGLARGINWAFANREKVSKAARLKAEKFSWESAIKQYADLFQELWERKQQQAKGPKVSVIVTNYNLEKYLPDCLESVKRQAETFDDFECLIVDDASPNPKGREIAAAFVKEDSHFRSIELPHNLYLAGARNAGIEQALGQYILPLDADDMLAPGTLHTLASALDQDRETHVAYGNVLFIEDDGALSNFNRIGSSLGHSGWPTAFKWEWQIYKDLRNLLPYCSMFRKEAWALTGGYRTRCRTAEDADFWVRLSSYGFTPRMVTGDDTLVYRVRPGSMSVSIPAPHWISWFPWSRDISLAPAGASSEQQLPVPSHDPAIIAVVIPVGPGHGKYVLDAIDSIDAQSFRSWECIVVNDSGEPLPRLPTWVRVFETQSEGRKGVAAARNLGIASSLSPLFVPLDADDFLEPDALDWLFKAFLQNRGEVIYPDFWQEKAPGSLTRFECDDYIPENLSGRKRTFKGEVREGMIHSALALYPKEAWKLVGGYDETLPAWEDWDFQLAIADKGICSRRIAAPLFVYRTHTGTRREDNYQNFERSKEGIQKKWARLWQTGGAPLMACGSCGARQTIVPSAPSQLVNGVPRSLQGQDAVLVQYTGPRMGGVTFRGAASPYTFSANEPPKYVLASDLHIFLNRDDFRILIKEEVAIEETAINPNAGPTLTAVGPPVR